MAGAAELVLLGVGIGIKLLLAPSYHSTDFEVHRNWLALTHSLPVSQWYYEDRSEWTLDYPPFFAWFEWTLSQLARWWDALIVDVDNLGYAAPSCVMFQRLTVIVSELVLFMALQRFVKINSHSTQAQVAAALGFFSPGFLFVDHIHFQYNGFLFGMLVYSLVLAYEGRDLLSGIMFAVLLCFKHIFMYIAPAYFVYLLLNYCLVYTRQQNADRLNLGASILRLLQLGVYVLAVFGIAFGPFAAMGQIPQLLLRLFPFKRGLCHAYWAPNFWALYSFVDRMLIVGSRIAPNLLPNLRVNAAAIASTTRGLVGDSAFAVLPDIAPLPTFVLTLVAQIPACAILLSSNRRSPTRFVQSVVLCAYASFLFGWHVHEKAIILVLAPLGLLMAAPTRLALRMFVVLAVSGYYSLFPLLFGMQELLLKTAILLIWSLCALSLLKADGESAWKCLSALEKLYIAGHIPLFVLTELVPAGAFGHLQFLPLALVSVYTAIGVLYSWCGLILDFLFLS
ncbi:glycosyl transferase [Coemansia interrupta]|uniref:Alpha-1,3-glucosyltransferase n=1 Tax=Coemansia interrupta TaxID=1126814 RepID=A0A9W8HKJ9_9FUNG|nr:glycosyl transferase [Coemansia interrupta]